MELPPNRGRAQNVLWKLRERKWIDLSTRAVLIDFNVMNLNYYSMATASVVSDDCCCCLSRRTVVLSGTTVVLSGTTAVCQGLLVLPGTTSVVRNYCFFVRDSYCLLFVRDYYCCLELLLLSGTAKKPTTHTCRFSSSSPSGATRRHGCVAKRCRGHCRYWIPPYCGVRFFRRGVGGVGGRLARRTGNSDTFGDEGGGR